MDTSTPECVINGEIYHIESLIHFLENDNLEYNKINSIYTPNAKPNAKLNTTPNTYDDSYDNSSIKSNKLEDLENKNINVQFKNIEINSI
jgi:hypothetical protein